MTFLFDLEEPDAAELLRREKRIARYGRSKPSAEPKPPAPPPKAVAPNLEPVQQRTFTPHTAQGAGRTWSDPVAWHIRCDHGRVLQFCVDCKRSRA